MRIYRNKGPIQDVSRKWYLIIIYLDTNKNLLYPDLKETLQ